MAQHRFHLIHKNRCDFLKGRLGKKTSTHKTRYKFDIYSIDKNLYYTHQIPIPTLYPQAILLATDTLVDIVLDDDRLCVVNCSSANSKTNIPLTIID